MLKSCAILIPVLVVVGSVRLAEAADAFPKSGVFIEREQFSESELNFARRYIGFPDEECTFKAPKRLKPNLWRVTTTCAISEDGKTKTSTATLEKRGKTWRLRRGEDVMNFTK
jgi:hypothetical protein